MHVSCCLLFPPNLNRIQEGWFYPLDELTWNYPDESLTRKVTLYNSLLAKLCLERNWQLISHNNIDKSHLNSYGLHLNKNGTSILAKNIKHFLITKYSKDI